MSRILALVAGCALLAGCGPAASKPVPSAPPANAELQRQVVATERAFADTMARRDATAFAGFIDPEAVFYSDRDVLRGKAAVVTGWKATFEGSEAPFSWEPDSVEVLDSGTLAISTGPVRDPSGRVTGRFYSIWRRDDAGQWRIVFDKGGPPEPADREDAG
jgi:ketosteroid isomerase-like protein